MNEHKTTFRLLFLKYGNNPIEWELWKQAWAKYPTLKKDCPTTRRFKELAREGFVSKLRVNKVN